MSAPGPEATINLQDLRVKLYDLLGYRYSAVSPSPGALMLLQTANILPSTDEPVRCRGRIRGVGFNGKRVSVQEVSTGSGEGAFDGVILSISHALPIYGRIVVLPDGGADNPRHLDGMKRVEFPVDRSLYGFAAYADNLIEGRSLISSNFAHILSKFKAHLPSGLASAAFAGRQMHVALPTAHEARFSDEVAYSDHEVAAKQIACDVSALLDLVAQADSLQAAADRHYPADRHAARSGYYEAKIQSAPPLISAAMEAGIVTDSRRAKYLTREAAIANPALQGLILSGA